MIKGLNLVQREDNARGDSQTFLFLHIPGPEVGELRPSCGGDEMRPAAGHRSADNARAFAWPT
jgi:hypothetical protein